MARPGDGFSVMARKGPLTIEVVFGPLLATLFLVPMLIAGALGVGFSILATLADATRPLSSRLELVQSQAALIGWVAAGVAGVSALWIVVLRRGEEAGYGPIARLMLVAGLLAGVAAGARWLWLMLLHKPGYGALTWATWLALLLGPLVISVQRVWVLVLARRSP
jgi:hypothetical protein